MALEHNCSIYALSFPLSEVKTGTEKWKKACLGLLLVLSGAVSGGVIVGLSAYFNRLSIPTSRDVPEEKPLRSQPNIIIMLADDTGYADFHTFGNPLQEWTGVDKMASKGMKFTSMYVPTSWCTPSRASILTGRYPVRNGMFGSTNTSVPNLSWSSSGGLPKREVTISEALKDAGYATGMVGKWHLGINEYNSSDGSHLPSNHGFDYVGTILPLTQMWQCDPEKYTISEMSPVCFLYENVTIIEQPINLQTLTSRLVQETKNFITTNKNGPFFFFLSFPQTHAALFASPKFVGSSRRGPYGDSVNEMGWAVEEVLGHLTELEIDKDTLVIFLSDHGPVRDGCGEEGSNGPFRGGKVSTWEGGVRVPAVAWWPGRIIPGTVSHTVVNSMDLYPTILEVAGIGNYSTEKNILIDGKEITEILTSGCGDSPHEALFFYCSDMLTAVRYKSYKIHYHTVDLLAPDMAQEGRPVCRAENMIKAFSLAACQRLAVKHDPPLIFDVEVDPEEHVLLNPNKTENRRMLEIVDRLVKSHKASVIPVEPELDKPTADELAPCCNPPACFCNYNVKAHL